MKHLFFIAFLACSNLQASALKIETNQQIAHKLVSEGVKFYSAGEYAESAKKYLESIQHYPTVDAITNLCNLYLYGQGVPQNFNTALQLCEQSAKHNHPSALTMLGEMYLHGKGVPKNTKKAAFYYKKSADLGHAHAQYIMWLLNRETAPNMALKYLKKSARSGHNQAKKELKISD